MKRDNENAILFGLIRVLHGSASNFAKKIGVPRNIVLKSYRNEINLTEKERDRWGKYLALDTKTIFAIMDKHAKNKPKWEK